MTRRIRGLFGTIGIIVVTIAYPVAITALLAEALAAMPWWGSVPLFAVLGLLWCIPMALLIRWMARPD